jgi:2-amino-4-hydroxy-6-hydroxymethyldihydropteridine diphosphokinase
VKSFVSFVLKKELNTKGHKVMHKGTQRIYIILFQVEFIHLRFESIQMDKVYLGIGTNLGNRKVNLRKAVRMIGENIGRILDSSSVYETAPWGFEAETDFLNMVVRVETNYSPAEVMKKITGIELLLGRERNQDRYSSRVIDIDILLFDDLVINENGLKIPHPLMHERKFVLVPFNEIAPDILHPVLKMTIASLLRDCRDRSRIIKI